MIIREVSSKKELKDFVKFPNVLYKNCEHYVPALESSEIKILTKHPALSFCDLKMWLAYDEQGKIIGRIAGVVNHKCNELKNQKRVRFGWFDTVNDIEVAKALFQKVEEWGKTYQATEICGPSRFSNMEKQSMLVEGFDHTTGISSDYNYPYYPELVEQLGFEKEVDYVQYKVKVEAIPERIQKISEYIAQRNNIHIRHFKNKKELMSIGYEFFHVLNQSYQQIYNFIPLTDEEIDFVIKDNFSFANLDLVSVLEDEKGKVVGFSFCMPSLNKAFQKAKGKLFPFGWMHILHDLRKNKNLDLYLTGVLPEYNNSGIHTLYHHHLNQVALDKGYEYAFTGQQLESNPAGKIWEKYNSEFYFRRRCYRKSMN